MHLTIIATPGGMIHECGECGEYDEHPCSLTRSIIKEKHESTTESEDDSDDERDGRE